MKQITFLAAGLAGCCLLTWGTMVQADEGMWLLSAPPYKLLEARHKFTLTDEWRRGR